jgi:hypothetical protein
MAQVNNSFSRDTVGVVKVVEQEAFFKDTFTWRKYLERNLRVPNEWTDSLAKLKITENCTTISVTFIICADGGVCEVNANKDAPPALAKEAIRIIKKSNGKWKAAQVGNNPVKSYHVQDISFFTTNE